MLRPSTAQVLLPLLLCFGLTCTAAAQTPEPTSNKQPQTASDLDAIRRQLREQQEELERMRTKLTEQSQVIDELRQRVEQSEQPQTTTNGGAQPGQITQTDALPAKPSPTPGGATQQQTQPPPQTQAEHPNPVEEPIKGNTETRRVGLLNFSGDLRVRYETFLGQLNASANAVNPQILGNELSSRSRFRFRLRLGIRGAFGTQYEWGLRLVSGSLSNAVSADSTFTDFYTHKPFGLDQAYLAWMPRRLPGLRLQGGKFEVPWLRTEMTIDSELNPEGFSEAYARNFKKSTLKTLTFTAWQLPFFERTSAFVRDANGTVNVEQSRRNSRDLALYGAQVRARFEPSAKVGFTLALADLYYSGTQFITPIQVFGSQLQLPVTITIPATATTPAQTITTQVSIPREFLTPGNSNLGLSTANTNATNRDGRLSSGYNLVDLIGRLDLKYNKRFPVALIFDFVTNTQTHDVVAAAPNGSNMLLANNENRGYWAELQVGKVKVRGDMYFAYTFIRIEKDAVLTPFNYSDLIQGSDIRTHRLNFAYVVEPHVVLATTGFFSQRANGLLGVFGATPPGSLNRPTTTLQFDTIFRF